MEDERDGEQAERPGIDVQQSNGVRIENEKRDGAVLQPDKPNPATARENDPVRRAA